MRELQLINNSLRLSVVQVYARQEARQIFGFSPCGRRSCVSRLCSTLWPAADFNRLKSRLQARDCSHLSGDDALSICQPALKRRRVGRRCYGRLNSERLRRSHHSRVDFVRWHSLDMRALQTRPSNDVLFSALRCVKPLRLTRTRQHTLLSKQRVV